MPLGAAVVGVVVEEPQGGRAPPIPKPLTLRYLVEHAVVAGVKAVAVVVVAPASSAPSEGTARVVVAISHPTLNP